MQDARTVEPLELLLGGICPGEHLLRIELEQPLQRFGLGGGARKRREHQAAAVQVARAVRSRYWTAARLCSDRKSGSAITTGLPRAGAGAAPPQTQQVATAGEVGEFKVAARHTPRARRRALRRARG